MTYVKGALATTWLCSWSARWCPFQHLLCGPFLRSLCLFVKGLLPVFADHRWLVIVAVGAMHIRANSVGNLQIVLGAFLLCSGYVVLGLTRLKALRRNFQSGQGCLKTNPGQPGTCDHGA